MPIRLLRLAVFLPESAHVVPLSEVLVRVIGPKCPPTGGGRETSQDGLVEMALRRNGQSREGGNT